MKSPIRTTRRAFLEKTAAASAAAFSFSIIPASALGREGAAAPSERIVMGCIGTGGRGRRNAITFMKEPDVQVVAVCDVDARHRDMARDSVNKHYENKDCAAYNDFRELVARDDLDAVSVATPDHWHALTSIAAADAGLDVYCEKPLANSIGEGRAIVESVRRNDRVLQTGSHERSRDNCRLACELVRSGHIGELKAVRINLPASDPHHEKVRLLETVPPEVPVPEGFDYDMWLGHTPKVPYTEKRCHFWWRFILAYGGGEMTDRGAHIIDLAQLGAGKDATGPVRIEATGIRSETSLYDAFMDYKFVNTYADGLRFIGTTDTPRGLKFEGSEGSIFIHVHGGKLEAEPASLLEVKVNEDDSLGRSPGHHRNFLDSVKSRKQPFAPAEVGHRTATICHLNNIAMLLGRPLKWDPEKEQVLGDDEANALLTPKMRKPWSL